MLGPEPAERTHEVDQRPGFADGSVAGRADYLGCCEVRFRDAFGPKIDAALEQAEAAFAAWSPHTNADAEKDPAVWRRAVRKLWAPLHPLLAALGSAINRARTLRLHEVEVLHDLDLSATFLPGTSERIAGVHAAFTVLPTKTKPKKLTFTGAAGKDSAYLLKGLEDLHLDQAMMQFLDAANAVVAGTAARGSDPRVAALAAVGSGGLARSYAVVPLGRSGGFIQWVDAVPAYTLYKRAYMATHGGEHPPKPVVAFNAAAHPVLGRPVTQQPPTQRSVRRACSAEQLREVHARLVAGSPADWLRNALFLEATSAAGILAAARRFAHSSAAMAVVGYVLGLGDRHLDNVLVDPATGHVVHIDYNICFDRGLALYVPEVVPFRLTRSFVEAMGGAALGVRGPFAQAAEVVLGLLAKYRGLFARLLKSLVLDPSIDWEMLKGAGSGAAAPGGGDGDGVNGEDPPMVGTEEGGDEDGDMDRLTQPTPSGVAVKPIAAAAADAPHDRGVRVLRSLYAKLDGSADEGPGAGSSVADRVSRLIDEAMDEGRLARMFEGWTPWL
ncbi:hypothetical protein H9P43_005440 [Blastocladiella emersonii ATCC 22665]|nr:hypothetical protein H9P43_005440 [Blastocladiella emersonii ATCC 22665]